MLSINHQKHFTKLSLIEKAVDYSKKHKISKQVWELTVNDMFNILAPLCDDDQIMLDVLTIRKTNDGHNVLFVDSRPQFYETFTTFKPKSIIVNSDSCDLNIIGSLCVFEKKGVDKCNANMYGLKTKHDNITVKYDQDGYYGEYPDYPQDEMISNVKFMMLIKPCMGYALYEVSN